MIIIISVGWCLLYIVVVGYLEWSVDAWQHCTISVPTFTTCFYVRSAYGSFWVKLDSVLLYWLICW